MSAGATPNLRRDTLRAGLLAGILALLGLVAAVPAADAQPARVWRIGFVSSASPSPMASRVDAFRRGLSDLGYVDGRNVTIDYRWAEGHAERLKPFVDDLVARKVDVIVVHGVVAAATARKATATVPLVCFGCDDIVSAGLVASLARPGGNLTGLTVISPEISGKRLELLREVVPGLARVAVLWNPANPVSSHELERTERAARSLGIALHPVGVSNAAELAGALSAVTPPNDEAMIVFSDAMLYGRLAQIATIAAANRLPTVSSSSEFASQGGLMSYGPDLFAVAARAAGYVDRILRGANPAELPIERPTKFEVVVNLATARTLRLTVPASLLERADTILR
jgi:putative ABC transport system substrate-binding protein